jgi:hypothetical protein
MEGTRNGWPEVPRDMFEHVQFPKDLISWFEDHHGLAPWVEALGVFVAIVGSVGIARWQDRRTRRREREQQTFKAKSVAGCFVPILKIIEFDVREISAAYVRVPRMTVQELRQPRYQFRELPPSVSFVLDNAYLLPGEAIASVPQLLSLRELVANDIRVVLARHAPAELLSDEEMHVITTWLGMMQGLVDEIYEQLEAIHDTAITQSLEQEPPTGG